MNDSLPRVSAVLISWNRLHYLKKSLYSLHEQQYPDLEILVVDNGSWDGSREWLWEQEGIAVIENEKNVGASAARNQGTAHASGKYVLYMDSDAELVTGGGLERLVRYLEEHPEAAGASGLIYADEARKNLWCCSPSMDWEGNHDPQASLEIKERPNILSTCFSLFRREAVCEVGGFDEYFFYLYEDGDLCERLGKKGYIFRIDSAVEIVHHYADPGRTERGEIAFHYYHERLRMYYVMKNWGLRAFLRSWGHKVKKVLDFKKKFPYLPIICYIDIYIVRAFMLFLGYPWVRSRREKNWILGYKRILKKTLDKG